jgi:colanic acid/amylovoran biosynthesis glycosyltransferase
LVKQIALAKSDPSSLIHCLSKKGFRKGWSHFAVVQQLLKDDPDIIHFAFSSIAVRYLDFWTDVAQSVKMVVSCRGTAENIKPLIMPEENEQLREVLTKADVVHCVSAEMMRKLMTFGLTEQKAFINYPSIQTSEFAKNGHLPLQSATMCIVSVGRLTFQKGYAYALHALKILADKNISFTYHIVGEGADRNMITYLIEELGLKGYVVMHGKAGSEKVLEVLKTADVFLLPSLSEGVSNAALEAMAMELPVVSTTAGGMTEVITHGENGLLTDWRSPQHMADQLMWLQQNPCRAIEMGARARLTIEDKFSLDRQIDIFIEQYRKLCN